MITIIEAPYLRKSIKIFRFYFCCLLFSLLSNTLLGPFKEGYLVLIETIVGLPIFAVIVMAPIGLFNSWKSYKAKEEPRKKRTIFLIGHMFFCSLIVLFILAMIKDISKLII